MATERFEEWCPGPASSGSDSVDSVPVLGLGLHVFAEPIAALTDSEEMVLALIHPLVQVYTIPKTGHLAYVGHVCNFRQKVVKFVASLPILPQDMPFVFVRPRVLKTQKSHPAPFKVDVNKVKRAYDWLKAHNPYYANIPWEPSAEEAWKEDDVQMGTDREEEVDLNLVCPLVPHAFVRWLERGSAYAETQDGGFPIAARVHAHLSEDAEGVSHEPLADSERSWNAIREFVAKTLEIRPIRMAQSLDIAQLAVAMHLGEILHIDLAPGCAPADQVAAVRAMGAEEWSEDLHMLWAELNTVQEELRADEPIETVGGIATTSPEDDVAFRELSLIHI